jgi:hypothetical protein
MQSSKTIESLHSELRAALPYHAADVYQSERMHKAAEMV